ncbi:MAG: hypothetical protein A2020_04165 [Lentisphaerae bacterium GWF2_45_14]|nr:MAG: hypothetical protein A2020_04165 [Lentisphaerae bacterium GWF2_45_14]
MRYSLDKISQELGVSKTTVSMILNGKARQYAISRKLEEQVKEFCRTKNYAINFHARQMRSQRAESVGVLIPEAPGGELPTPFSDVNITEIIGGISNAAFTKGFRFSTQGYSDSYQWKQVYDWINSREVDGIITYGWLPRNIIAEMTKRQLPAVAISEEPALGLPTVTVDDYDGACKITEMLVSEGHRDFIYITGTVVAYTSMERQRAFLSIMEKYNIPFYKKDIISANFMEESAYAQMKKKVAEKRFKATAIVCGNDMMAIGAMRALKEAGFSIPQDISVTGADDINLCNYVSPRLTTFTRHLREIGETAFTLLYDIIDGKSAYDTHLTLPTKLVIRESSGRAPGVPE